MKKQWKKSVWIKRPSLDHSDFSGSIEQVIDNLKFTLKELKEQGYENIQILLDAGCNSIGVDLYGDKLETESEAKRRIETEEAQKRNAKKQAEKEEREEKALYRKLKKKYEKQ